MNDDAILQQQIDATPLHDALAKLGTGGEGVELGGSRDQQGHVVVEAEATSGTWKGWSASAAFQWAKESGYAALGKLSWKPKP